MGLLWFLIFAFQQGRILSWLTWCRQMMQRSLTLAFGLQGVLGKVFISSSVLEIFGIPASFSSSCFSG